MNSVVLALFPCLLATTVVGAAVPHRAKTPGVRRAVAEQVESARLPELATLGRGLELRVGVIAGTSPRAGQTMGANGGSTAGAPLSS